MLFRCNEYDPNRPFNQAELYDKCCKIHYRLGGRDDTLVLQVKITLINWTGCADEKSLKITITDDKNPLFLYVTELTSDVYAKVKQKLDLRVDFSQFPDELVRLLEQCDDTEAGSKYVVEIKEEPNDVFGLVDGRCIYFKIMEINRFQKVCLVALHMSAGSESEINALMARNVLALKKYVESMRVKCKDTEERCMAAEEALKMKHFEIEQVKNQAKEQVRSERQKLAEEIDQLKRNCDSVQSEYDRRLRLALHDQEIAHKDNVASLENAIERLRGDLTSSKISNTKLQSELSDKDEIIEKFHKDMKILQDEILRAENKIGKLENELKEKNAFVLSIKQRLSHVEKDRDEKDKAARKLGSLLEAAESSKNYLKNALKEKFEGLEKKERDFAALSKDLSKANEIIAKINKEMNILKHKLGDRTATVVELQKRLDDLESKVTQTEIISNEKDHKLTNLSEENAKLKDDLLDAQNCIKIKEELIKKNERIIGWLNDIVGKQGANLRPESSSSKSSGVSTLAESNKVTSGSKKISNGTAANGLKASGNQKTTNNVKTRPDFRTY